jgi:hypothetical protein
MNQKKMDKWKDDRDAALDFYHNSNMKVSQIARALKLSVFAVDRMITGHIPKSIAKKGRITEMKEAIIGCMEDMKDDITKYSIEESKGIIKIQIEYKP